MPGHPRDRTVLVLSEVLELKKKGWTNAEIAREKGVTRQAVTKLLRGHGIYARERSKVTREHFPWVITDEHSRTSAVRRLRDHAAVFLSGRDAINPTDLKRLSSWYVLMENHVLMFDPHLPPVPGEFPYGGFALKDRTPDDGNLLIRVNEYTKLTDEGKIIWARPAKRVE
jgi:hypothetical protein